MSCLRRRMEPAEEDYAATPVGIDGTIVEDRRSSCDSAYASALPGGGNFPVDFVIASSAEPQQLVQIANQLVAKGVPERNVHLCGF